jgi:hypothetical protein
MSVTKNRHHSLAVTGFKIEHDRQTGQVLMAPLKNIIFALKMAENLPWQTAVLRGFSRTGI